MSRSTAALLIAIMFHLLLALIFYILFINQHFKEPKVPVQHRIKVSLKQKPKTAKKSAAVKNKIKPIKKALSMPKGRQLKTIPKKKAPKIKKVIKRKKPPVKKIIKKEPVKVKKRATVKTAPIKKIIKKEPVKKLKKIKSKIVQTQKKTKKVVELKKVIPIKKIKKVHQKTEINDFNKTKKVKKVSTLYALLSKKQAPVQEEKRENQRGTRISQDIKEAYGEAFGKLSEGEQKYIIDNQEIMRRITQEQLNRLGPVNIPRNLNVDTMNIVEFYLHPNGDISDLRIVKPSGYQILDDTSLQTIEYSYHRYPLTKQKTLIRYKVGYHLDQRRY